MISPVVLISGIRKKCSVRNVVRRKIQVIIHPVKDRDTFFERTGYSGWIDSTDYNERGLL